MPLSRYPQTGLSAVPWAAIGGAPEFFCGQPPGADPAAIFPGDPDAVAAGICPGMPGAAGFASAGRPGIGCAPADDAARTRRTAPAIRRRASRRLGRCGQGDGVRGGRMELGGASRRAGSGRCATITVPGRNVA